MPKDYKEKFEELETRHHYIAGNLLDAIWVIDVDTLRFEYITPSIEQITGYTAEQYIQLTIKDRLTNSAFEGAIKVLTEEKAKFERGIEVKRKLKLELIHKNGYPYWIEISAKLFRDPSGVLKIVGITREITKQKKAEMQKDALIIKLQEALAEKERLLKENKVLRGLLPVCSGCKRIRDNKGNWWPLDAYIAEHTEADITHTICGDCKTALYGDLDDCRHAKSA